jgi:TrmH family RNA methyltransferase
MITSNSNPKIVEIRKLQDSKFRKLSGLYVAEGLKAIGQAFDSHALVKTIIYSSELLVSDFGQMLVDKFSAQADVEIIEVSPSVFEGLARKEKPQGIAAVIQQKWAAFADLKIIGSGLVVAVDSIQNPGNLGTILRTCDAVGAKALILLNYSTDPYDPVAVKASMGSIFTIPLIRLTSQEFLDWAGANAIPIVGTSDKASQSCFSYRFPSPCIVLIGSEREGLPQELVERTTEMVSIDMEGAVDSLNISVATGIILYQAYLSHKASQGKQS